jgi:hypothetical protein
MVGPTDDD